LISIYNLVLGIGLVNYGLGLGDSGLDSITGLSISTWDTVWLKYRVDSKDEDRVAAGLSFECTSRFGFDNVAMCFWWAVFIHN